MSTIKAILAGGAFVLSFVIGVLILDSSWMTAGTIPGGTVGFVPAPQNSVMITGTVNANVVNTMGVLVLNPSSSPIPIATGSANFRVNVDLQTPAMTMPVSFPQATLPGIVATVQVNSRELNTVGVILQSTPPMPTVYVTGVPAPVGTVFVNNPLLSPIPIATGTAGFRVNVDLQTPAMTQPVSLPTIGVQMFNTPAVQGSVSLNNTPAILQWDQFAGPTSMATSGGAGSTLDITSVGAGALRFSIFGTWTASIGFSARVNQTNSFNSIVAYPVTNGEISGAGVTNTSCAGTCNVWFVVPDIAAHTTFRLTMTSFTSGSAVVNVESGPGAPFEYVVNTPAVQGSVSINNTPAVQGSVSINNTPAVQGSVSINNTPMVQQPTTNPCLNPAVLPTSLAINLAASATAIIATPAAANRLIICDINFTNGASANVRFDAASATASLVCPSPTPMTGSVVGNFSVNGEPAFSLGIGQKLCAWPQGTAINVQGVVSYVQQ